MINDPKDSSISPIQNSVQIWIADLENLMGDIINYRELLTEDEIYRADRYKFYRDSACFIKGRYLMRMLSAHYLDSKPSSIQFDYNSFGKPSFQNDLRLFFNLSHSRNMVVFVLTDISEIGIDIEYVDKNLDHLDIGKSVFSDSEMDLLTAVPGSKRAEKFFELWTRKEAFIKALGYGFSMPVDLKEINVLSQQLAFESRTYDHNLPFDPSWMLYSFEPEPNYKAAICLRELPGKISFNNWG